MESQCADASEGGGGIGALSASFQAKPLKQKLTELKALAKVKGYSSLWDEIVAPWLEDTKVKDTVRAVVGEQASNASELDGGLERGPRPRPQWCIC